MNMSCFLEHSEVGLACPLAGALLVRGLRQGQPSPALRGSSPAAAEAALKGPGSESTKSLFLQLRSSAHSQTRTVRQAWACSEIMWVGLVPVKLFTDGGFF